MDNKQSTGWTINTAKSPIKGASRAETMEEEIWGGEPADGERVCVCVVYEFANRRRYMKDGRGLV